MENDQISQTFFRSPNTSPMLSPEQWACFFDDLTPEDFLSVINTCPEWNEMLHSKKTTNLLSLVLPLVIDYFPQAAILAFRRVSTVAKTLINETLESRVHSTLPNFPKTSLHEKYEESLQRRKFNDELAAINSQYNFRSSGSSQRFLKCVDPNYQLDAEHNPFLTRSIFIVLNGADDDDFHWLCQMILNFGHHIWHLKCTLEHGVGRIRPVRKLTLLLHHFPNLRALELFAPQFERPTGNRLRRFREAVLPDPDLPHLESLCLHGWFTTLEAFSSGFLRRYGAQLKTLSITESILSLQSVTAEFLQQFVPNIKNLQVENVLLSGLTKISQAGWELEKLTLKGRIYSDVTHNAMSGFGVTHNAVNCVSIEQLFNFLGGFSQSLTELEILIPSHSPQDYSFSWMPKEIVKELSMLKVLRLNLDMLKENNWVWTFLEKMCQNVELLHFEVPYKELDFDNTMFENVTPRYPTLVKIQEMKQNTFGRALQILPKLQRTVFWRYVFDRKAIRGRLEKFFKSLSRP